MLVFTCRRLDDDFIFAHADRTSGLAVILSNVPAIGHAYDAAALVPKYKGLTMRADSLSS